MSLNEKLLERIEELEKANEKLKENSNELRAVLNSMGGHYVAVQDALLKVTKSVNEVYKHFADFAKKQNETISDLVEPVPAEEVTDDRPTGGGTG